VTSALVTWQIVQEAATTWRLTLTVAGRSYAVAQVEAVDRDAAVQALATQIELALTTWRPRIDE
jgi:hypothetical protein